jgi:universal stress protein A
LRDQAREFHVARGKDRNENKKKIARVYRLPSKKEKDMAFGRILCAVDFSDHSNEAFLEAIELAENNRAALFLLHALEVQPLLTQWLATDGLSDLTMKIERKAQESMDSLVNSEASRLEKLKLHTEITSGRAHAEILENAFVWRADLIVMGARGTGALEDAVLGSTVNRVLGETECSVLVVKKDID